MPNTIRNPRIGITENSRRIAAAVDDEDWQKFRVSMKGKTTREKLNMLRDYYYSDHECDGVAAHCKICVRVDNYIKALCRGGQLHPGESLETALAAEFFLKVKRY